MRPCEGCGRNLSMRNVIGLCRGCHGRSKMSDPSFKRGHGSPRLVWTPEMDAALREGRANGVGIQRLAARIGVANNSIIKRSRELGLPSLPCVLLDRHRARLAALISDANDDVPVDFPELRVLRIQLGAQAESIERGLVE